MCAFNNFQRYINQRNVHPYSVVILAEIHIKRVIVLRRDKLVVSICMTPGEPNMTLHNSAIQVIQRVI